jgi:broad specificity phosphatase PhoE
MLTFQFIRHAESEANLRPHIISGQSVDAVLSADGRKQAAALGVRYQPFIKRKNYKLWASTALRTQQTAAIFCEKVGIEIEELQLSPLLLELSQGDWAGLVRSETYTPEVLAQIQADNLNFKAPNGESQAEVADRMMQWLETQIAENQVHTYFLVFTHGVAIKCLFQRIMQSNPQFTHLINIQNTSITEFKHSEKGFSLEKLNDHAHLYF